MRSENLPGLLQLRLEVGIDTTGRPGFGIYSRKKTGVFFGCRVCLQEEQLRWWDGKVSGKKMFDAFREGSMIWMPRDSAVIKGENLCRNISHDRGIWGIMYRRDMILVYIGE